MAWCGCSLATLEAARQDSDADRRARDAVKRSLVHLADHKTIDPAAAEAGVRARHFLCRCCANALSQSAVAGEPMPDDVHEATDAVDDGLALVRAWENARSLIFRPLAFDLFRFGARVYAHYQPHFLREFIEENMNPTSRRWPTWRVPRCSWPRTRRDCSTPGRARRIIPLRLRVFAEASAPLHLRRPSGAAGCGKPR